jgi:hypothetical protein
MSETFDFRAQKDRAAAEAPKVPSWVKGDMSLFQALAPDSTAFGTLPLQAGRRRLSPEQDAQLEAAGVPKYVPDEVPIYGEPRLPVAPDRPPLKVETIDIATLPPEEQAAKLRAIAEVQRINSRHGAEVALPPIGKVIEVEEPPRPEPNHLDSVRLTPAGAAGLAVCPNCQHDLSQPADPEPDESDRRAFLSMLAGGRFTKEYAFYEGMVRVKFRSLLTPEIAAIESQLKVDAEADSKMTLFEMRRLSSIYWRVLSVAELTITGQPKVTVPPLAEIPWDRPTHAAPGSTVLPTLVTRFHESVWPSESVFNVVNEAFQQFKKLMKRMEDLRTDPGFIRGIG